ncbi:recA bacterial DNA recombination family protein [[Clostridium] sordellii ATCC 9714]|nr:recA bacterial DNA recombination family protein [[Clostridium] sordellii ATCC 9714] [Paeniclostridium sordellii ATCC 9714]
MYGEGISKVGDLLDIATDVDIVKKSGAWYSYNETKLGQGRENVKKFLSDNPDLIEEIEVLVRKYYKLDENREGSSENEESTENIGE